MTFSLRPRALATFALKPLVASLLITSLPVHAVTRQVANEAELFAAITEMNGLSGANFIEFTADITLSAALPPITSTITIKGHGKTLSGDSDGDGTGDVQLFVVGSNSAPGTSVLLQVSNLTLEHGLAKGANGTAGGDGADGTGGALQINSNADVILKDVKILNSGAVGGAGDAANGSGGNALGGGIYVAQGGRLSMSGTADPNADPLSAPANIGAGGLQGGTAQGTGSAGVAAGDSLFLDGSGNLRLTTNPNTVLKIEGGISDSMGAGLGTGSWNILLEGGGGAPTDTTDPTADLNFGTIVLGGTNNYSGDTFISDVNVGVTSMGALGSGGVVALDNGGLIVAPGVDVNRELVLASGGGRIGVFSGQGILSGDVTGTGDLLKVGAGDLELLGNSNFDGDWRVREGALVIDSDTRLGVKPNLILDGGGLKFSADVNNMRAFELTTRNAYIDSDGNDVVFTGAVTGWDGLINDVELTLRDSAGGGSITFAEVAGNVRTGKTHIESGTVIGNIASGGLTVDAGATYNLGVSNRTIGALNGAGNVETNAHNLKISLDEKAGAASPVFSGVISGAGSVTIGNALSTFVWKPLGVVELMDMSQFKTQELSGVNTYSGGTMVTSGGLLKITDANNLGSGALTLQNGALETSATSLSLDINLAGSVGILKTNTDMDFYGTLIGSADFLKIGSGTLTLHNTNPSFSGDTVVMESGSYIALSDPNALGNGRLILAEGGGLKVLANTNELRPVKFLAVLELSIPVHLP